MTHLWYTQLRIGVDLNLTLVNNCIKLILNTLAYRTSPICFDTETCIESILADTDTDHITLTGMHIHPRCSSCSYGTYARITGSKVRLHALAGNLYDVSDAVLAAQLQLIEVRSDQLSIL